MAIRKLIVKAWISTLDVNATKVDLSYSKITSDDLILIVERLKEMPNLIELDLRGNQITSIEGLSELVGITSLYLEDNNQIDEESLALFLTMRITTTNKTLDFRYDGKTKKLSWSTIAATISQTIERYPEHFLEKDRTVWVSSRSSESNHSVKLPLSTYCDFDPTKQNQHQFVATTEDYLPKDIPKPNPFLSLKHIEGPHGQVNFDNVPPRPKPLSTQKRAENIQAHLTTCQLIYYATSPTAKDNRNRDRTDIATSAISPEVRRWANTLGTKEASSKSLSSSSWFSLSSVVGIVAVVGIVGLSSWYLFGQDENKGGGDNSKTGGKTITNDKISRWRDTLTYYTHIDK
jgi:hypothetical protein